MKYINCDYNHKRILFDTFYITIRYMGSYHNFMTNEYKMRIECQISFNKYSNDNKIKKIIHFLKHKLEYDDYDLKMKNDNIFTLKKNNIMNCNDALEVFEDLCDLFNP